VSPPPPPSRTGLYASAAAEAPPPLPAPGGGAGGVGASAAGLYAGLVGLYAARRAQTSCVRSHDGPGVARTGIRCPPVLGMDACFMLSCERMRADMQSHRGDQHQCEGVGCPTHAESRPRQDESEAQPCSFLGAAMRARGTCSAQPRGRPLPAAACQKPESLLAGRAMLLPKQQRARAWRRRRVLRRRRGVLRRRLARRLRRVQRRRRADGCGATRGAPSATRMISRAAAQCRRTGALERAD